MSISKMWVIGSPLVRILLIILIFSLLSIPVGVVTSNVCGHSLADPLVVRVGVYENPPKVFTGDDGDVQGLFPDVIEYIAAEEGWVLEYVAGNWTECLERLDSNEIDLMVDVAISDERLDEYAFSNESMFLSWGIVYAQPDSVVESIPELDGMKMAVMKESIHTIGENGILNLIEEFQVNVTIVEYDDYAQVFESLDNRDVDVGVVNRIFGGMYDGDYDVVRTPIIFNPTDLRYATPENSTIGPYLIERIDSNLRELKRDPDSVYYQSLHTYMPYLFEDDNEVPQWLMPALLSSFGVLVLIVSMNLLLRHKVKTRTAELQDAYEALIKEKSRSDLYLDLMSHDIANIDQGIYTFAELADRESVDNPELQMYMSGILRHVHRAVGLIGAVRLLSTLRNLPLQPVSISLKGVVKDCIDDVLKSFPEEDVKIKFDPPADDIRITAEPLVSHVFSNILNNAVRHQRREKKRVEVDITHEPGLGSVTVIVSDHGPGVPDAMKSRLLQRSEMTSDVRLTGIGLALVKDLIDRYNGTIEIKDRVEGDHTQGARFVMTFPVDETE